VQAVSKPKETEMKNWRDHLPVHPAAELFPLMSEVERKELADDIEKCGLRDPPSLYRDPELGLCVLDGRNRLDALELIGWPTGVGASRIIKPIEPFDPVAFIVSKNLHRRHLTTEQKRELIAKLLKAKPEQSNRQIAKQVKADDKTVAKVRTELESTAEIPQLKKTKGKDGKARPVKAKKKSISITDPAIKAAIDAEPEVKPALAVTIPTQAGTLGSEIKREWREATRAFETLTSHTPAQVATAILPEDAPLVTEIANYFAKLVKLICPTGNEAPTNSIPDDLSVPAFLKRGAGS
jgi:hypothetical protein